MIRIHRRQFVLGPEARPAGEDWVARALGPQLVLSLCPELNAAFPDDADGAPWALLGHAVDCRPWETRTPAEQVAGTPTERVPGRVEGWLGRWVLLGPRDVQLDAAGRLGVFHGRDGSGAVWCSSSPALLAQALWPGGPPERDPRVLRYQVGMAWFPGPSTRFPGMHRLLASQVLDPSSGAIAHRRLVVRPGPERGDAENFRLVEEHLATGVRRLASLQEEPLALGLSSGRDSRLVLAMACRAGVAVECVTRVAPRTPLGDRILPPQLAARAGMSHRFLDDSPNPLDVADVIARHTADHVSLGDGEPLARGPRGAMSGILIGGWEPVGNPSRTFPDLPETLDDLDLATDALMHVFRESPRGPAVVPIRAWLEWVVRTPEDGLGWRDRMIIEQAAGGLYSAKEQLYDVQRVVRLPVFNSATIHGLILSLSDDARRERAHQIELIRRARPELLELPWNPPDRHFGLGRALVRRVRHPRETIVRGRRWVLHASQRIGHGVLRRPRG